MIKWSEEIRNADYTYFCKAAIEKYKAAECPIWIVSDCRRKTDFQFFKENFGEKVVTKIFYSKIKITIALKND